jgi:hypothetical protein
MMELIGDGMNAGAAVILWLSIGGFLVGVVLTTTGTQNQMENKMTDDENGAACCGCSCMGCAMWVIAIAVVCMAVMMYKHYYPKTTPAPKQVEQQALQGESNECNP